MTAIRQNLHARWVPAAQPSLEAAPASARARDMPSMKTMKTLATPAPRLPRAPASPALRRLPLLVALALPYAAIGAETVLDPVLVRAPMPAAPIGSANVTREALQSLTSSTSDSARLLGGVPGVSTQGAGGVSSLPTIRGLGDDRLRIRVDGADLISSCANHMNPPLSYLDPTDVDGIQVYAGLSPVSAGGDGLGGTIVVNSLAPRFAKAGEGTLTSGEIGGHYRSNGNATGVNAAAELATETLSVRYAGSTAQAGNYRAARDFKPDAIATYTRSGTQKIDGDEVGSSAYQTQNHQLGIAYRRDNHLLDLKVAYQNIAEQGFPNQHMDMTGNESTRVNLGYQGEFGWGRLNARAWHEDTRHDMDFGPDKLYWYGMAHNVAGMPMSTRGRTTGLNLGAEFSLSARDLLRVGAESQRYRLNDFWDPVANSPMMSPNTFLNIRDGRRDRYDAYAEWEASWSPQWLTLAGVRSSTVKTDAGTVQGYNAMYGADAAAFNKADRSRSDRNWDLSVLARYTPDARQSYEGGYTRKTRSPNLYERYTWSSNKMAMAMNNWVNDGNGYIGAIDLEPEVAHTFSVSADWHDAQRTKWAVKLTPYLSFVDNYIDAVRRAGWAPGQFNYLGLANQDARLYGIDLSGFATLGTVEGVGSFALRGLVGYVHGRNADSGEPLYNVMPLNARLSLEHRSGNWSNTVDQELVSGKDRVSGVRNERETGGYGLTHLSSSYTLKSLRLDVGIENLFDKYYALPLGGAYIGQGTTMSLNGAGAPYGYSVPGMGRSVYVGANLKF